MNFVKNFTVGPSKLYHGVSDFIKQSLDEGVGEISHRSKKFTDISKDTIENFISFFNIPKEYKVFYTYSATEGMEIITRSSVTNKSYHISSGNFGNVWINTAKGSKKNVTSVVSDEKNKISIDDIKPEEDTELIAITANETSSGIAYSPEEIEIISKKFPNILLAVDVTSSMGAIKYNFSSADAWFFSVQKCLGLPAGLGILIISPRVWQKAEQRKNEGYDIGCHHNLFGMNKKMPEKYQTPTTPNVLAIAGLGYICKRFQNDFKTIDNLNKITNKKAEKVYDFLNNHKELSPNLDLNSGESKSVIVADASREYIENFHQVLKSQGIIVGTGYGGKKLDQIRIANFPVHSEKDFDNLFFNIPS